LPGKSSTSIIAPKVSNSKGLAPKTAKVNNFVGNTEAVKKDVNLPAGTL
jgi:hypothetical protein